MCEDPTLARCDQPQRPLRFHAKTAGSHLDAASVAMPAPCRAALSVLCHDMCKVSDGSTTSKFYLSLWGSLEHAYSPRMQLTGLDTHLSGADCHHLMGPGSKSGRAVAQVTAWPPWPPAQPHAHPTMTAARGSKEACYLVVQSMQQGTHRHSH